MLDKIKKRVAYLHGFFYSFFGFAVILNNLKWSDELKKEFLRGYFQRERSK